MVIRRRLSGNSSYARESIILKTIASNDLDLIFSPGIHFMKSDTNQKNRR
jgi:hypothetical protein